jgi:hypothetical protein
MGIERSLVILTMKALRDAVANACRLSPVYAARFREQDPGAYEESLDLACAQTGLAREAYEAALIMDVSLLYLQKMSIDEVIFEPPDPGPYDEISRESPAGTPENYHLHPWNGIIPPGGVGGSWPP